jgi:DNA-binding beta-propeller fold protein YncE
LASDSGSYGTHTIHEFNVADGSRRRVIGRAGDGPLHFAMPCHVCIAPDGFVFVADCRNRRVQVLTPTLDFHSFIGEGVLPWPIGVCANADIVVVSDLETYRISVFNRCDGTLLRWFGARVKHSHQLISRSGLCLEPTSPRDLPPSPPPQPSVDTLDAPRGLCFMSGDRHVAVADSNNDRVSVFSVDGEFIRHVGVGILNRPLGVACSALDELIVTDHDDSSMCLRVFGSTGDLLATFGAGQFTGVVVRGGAVFAAGIDGVTVFE